MIDLKGSFLEAKRRSASWQSERLHRILQIICESVSDGIIDSNDADHAGKMWADVYLGNPTHEHGVASLWVEGPLVFLSLDFPAYLDIDLAQQGVVVIRVSDFFREEYCLER